MTDPRDASFMARCLELARRAEGRTAPNPIVGAVVVDPRGRVLAEGWHRGAGMPHGEIEALGQLGGRAPGATLYVNLEPCNHTGRMPPCAPQVVASGVARVVIGMLDPFPGHGGGAEVLRAAGIEVTEGVLAEACTAANRPFVSWATRRRPWFVLKAAMSIDGKIAMPSGESRWITGAPARAHAHRLRDRCDAIVVGIGTVLADDPQLTVRGVEGGRDPARVVVDSQLRTPPDARVLPAASDSPARTIIATTRGAPEGPEVALRAAGAEVWRLPAAEGVDLRALAAELANVGLLDVMVEGGGILHAAFLSSGLPDELWLYVAPIILGGPAPSWVGGAVARSLATAPRWKWDAEPERLGDDWLLRAVAG